MKNILRTNISVALTCTIVCSAALSDALATNSSAESVSVVRTADFKVGRSWIWDYVDENEKIYSTERYVVLRASGSTVEIEMSSAYQGEQTFRPHHRLLVNIDDCLLAYRNPVQKKPWAFQMWALQTDGSWSEFDPGKTLAFEEKFNCNAAIFRGPSDHYATMFSTENGAPVFMQKLWRTLPASWFLNNGPNAGVALKKDFVASGKTLFTFHLR